MRAMYQLFLVLATFGSVMGSPHCPKICFCDKHLTSVNCEGKTLTELPPDIPPQVEKLYLRKNKIPAIPPFTFAKFPSLIYLDLRQNIVTSVDKNSFSNCTKLQTLYLTANNIVHVDPEAFTDTQQLSYLSLQGNDLKRVPPLPHLIRLTSLVLEGNEITDAMFPDSYSHNTALIDIVLSNNDILALKNGTFQSLQHAPVRKIELARNHITTVDSGAFTHLPVLSSLKIGYNPLDSSQLPNVIKGLSRTNLVSLDIRNVSFAGRLPTETFRLLSETNIRNLLMPNNKIDAIPAGAFEDIPTLIQLDLSGCEISTISSSAFTNLTDLQRLYLNDNSLSSVPKPLPPSLDYLYLKNNKIERLLDDDFVGLSRLQELHLRMNKIHELHENSFLGLTQLSKLYLSGNIISTLPGELFSYQSNLISLELDDNNINVIPVHDQRFASLRSLVYLNLDNNPLYEMPLDVLQPLKSLKYLHLTNNKLGHLIEQDQSGSLFKGLSKLSELHLGNNGIRILPEPLLAEQKLLQVMNVSRNRISHWEKNFFVSTRSLHTLDLSMNLVSLINHTSTTNLQSLKSLNLSGNPFACNCAAKWFCGWMNKTQIELTARNLYTCNLPPTWQGKHMSSFCAADIDCTNYTLYYIIGSAAGGLLLSLIIFGVMYRYRWYVRYKFYRISKRLRGGSTTRKDYEALSGDDKQFDIYLSYAEEDASWVADNILKLLDNGKYSIQNEGEFKVCFKERDWEHGKQEIQMMDECIPASRSVIIIGTKNYATCPQCEFELNLVVDLQAKGVIEDYRLVVVGNLPPKVPRRLEMMLQRHNYIEWVNVETAQETFVERLTDRLGRTDTNDYVNA